MLWINSCLLLQRVEFHVELYKTHDLNKLIDVPDEAGLHQWNILLHVIISHHYLKSLHHICKSSFRSSFVMLGGLSTSLASAFMAWAGQENYSCQREMNYSSPNWNWTTTTSVFVPYATTNVSTVCLHVGITTHTMTLNNFNGFDAINGWLKSTNVLAEIQKRNAWWIIGNTR